MIEAIQVAAEAAQPAAAKTSTGSQQASAFDLRDFAVAMERNGGASQAPNAAAPASVAQTQPSEGARVLAAALENLNGSANSVSDMAKTVTANATDLTPGEMIQMTMRCHQFMFTTELTSNVANRTSDGIQQLFRQQS